MSGVVLDPLEHLRDDNLLPPCQNNKNRLGKPFLTITIECWCANWGWAVLCRFTIQHTMALFLLSSQSTSPIIVSQLILCLSLPPLRGRFATISPTGSAGYLCGVEDRWAGVTYPPCITAKITQERQLYLEQYRRNMNTRLADLHVNRCTERRQYICMSYYENSNNIGESPCWHHTAV